MNINKIYTTSPAFKANPMPNEQAQHINNKLLEADSIDIFCHKKTDEDSFNSAKALYSYLESQGKNVRIISTENTALYQFDANKYNILAEDKVDESTKKADLAVCVDLSKDERLNPEVQKYLNRYSNNNIVGFDHHSEDSLILPQADTYKVIKSYESIKDMPVRKPKNFYIDSSSKSCAAVIYRFFEAIKRNIPYDEKLSLFCGMSDDMRKSGYINFLKSPKIEFSRVGKDDKNSQYVYNKIMKEIQEQDKVDIIKHVDPMSDLTPEERKFQKSLFKNVQVNENGKFAYVVIDKDDPSWIALGGDNSSTRRIVKDYRARLIQDNPADELISDELRSKLNNVQVVATVDSDQASNEFQVSLTSKADYVKRYADHIRDNFYPNLRVMGHSNRGGWSIPNDDQEKCKEFFNYFIDAAKNIDYESE